MCEFGLWAAVHESLDYKQDTCADDEPVVEDSPLHGPPPAFLASQTIFVDGHPIPVM